MYKNVHSQFIDVPYSFLLKREHFVVKTVSIINLSNTFLLGTGYFEPSRHRVCSLYSPVELDLIQVKPLCRPTGRPVSEALLTHRAVPQREHAFLRSLVLCLFCERTKLPLAGVRLTALMEKQKTRCQPGLQQAEKDVVVM